MDAHVTGVDSALRGDNHALSFWPALYGLVPHHQLLHLMFQTFSSPGMMLDRWARQQTIMCFLCLLVFFAVPIAPARIELHAQESWVQFLWTPRSLRPPTWCTHLSCNRFQQCRNSYLISPKQPKINHISHCQTTVQSARHGHRHGPMGLTAALSPHGKPLQLAREPPHGIAILRAVPVDVPAAAAPPKLLVRTSHASWYWAAVWQLLC